MYIIEWCISIKYIYWSVFIKQQKQQSTTHSISLLGGIFIAAMIGLRVNFVELVIIMKSYYACASDLDNGKVVESS